MITKACNEFVLVLRDKTETEIGGLILPSGGRTKLPVGTIQAVGSLVKDVYIKAGKGKKCIFHAGVGFELTYEGTTYLVLQDREIIALP